jgi:ABC-type glycerol-3-phosphate transport system substrate-binding protein
MVRLSLLLKAGHTVEIIRRLAPRFEAEQGIGLDIEVVTEDQAYQRLMSGERLPDVCTVPYWNLAELVDAGLLAPLEISDYPGESQPRALQAMTYESQVWGVPHTLTGGTLFTRADRVPDGFRTDADSFKDFLSMWDQLIQAGSSLTIRAGSAFSSAETYRGLLYASGVNVFRGGEDADPAGLKDPLEAIVSRLRQQKENLVSLQYGQMGQLFAEGLASMMFDTSAWATIFALDDSLSKLVSFGRLGSPSAPFFYAEGLGITQACAHPEWAKALIRWRHSPEVIREEVETLNRLDFPRVDIVGEEWFWRLMNKGINHAVFDEVVASWDSVPVDYPISGPGFLSWGRSLMATIADSVGGADLSQAIEKQFMKRCDDRQPGRD